MKTGILISILIPIMAVLSIFVSCATFQPVGFTIEKGDYVHIYSGMKFPAQIGLFHREGVYNYDNTGYDVSANYKLYEPGQVLVSVYIYPTSRSTSIMHEFDKVKAEIVQAHPGANWLGDTEVKHIDGEETVQGKKASYTYVSNFVKRNQQVLSYAYLFMRGEWYILYRITYPQLQHDTVQKEVTNFIQAIDWSSLKI